MHLTESHATAGNFRLRNLTNCFSYCNSCCIVSLTEGWMAELVTHQIALKEDIGSNCCLGTESVVDSGEICKYLLKLPNIISVFKFRTACICFGLYTERHATTHRIWC